MGPAIDLKRFKKTSDGIKHLASLIEQATEKQRKMIIQTVGSADAHFLEEALKKVVYFNELLYFEEGVIAEILATTPAIVLAYALKGMPDDFRKKISSLMGYRQIGQMKDEEDKMSPNPQPYLVDGAQRSILRIARQLEAKQSFTFALEDCPRFHASEKK